MYLYNFSILSHCSIEQTLELHNNLLLSQKFPDWLFQQIDAT